MKLTFTKEKLLDGLQQVQNVVSTRSTLPILSNTLLHAKKDEVSLSATDLDLALKCSVEAQVTKEGATTLPAHRVFSIIRELSQNDVSLEVDEKNVATIQSGGSLFKLNGLPETDFPQFPKLNGAKTFTMEQKILKDALKKTAYAMSADETRYVLNSVLLSIKDDKLMTVATDGRRLALSEHDLDLPKEARGDLLVPSKTVGEVQRLLKDKGNVTLGFNENQICLEMNGTLLVSKLVDGAYPNYKQVIPSEAKERVSLERETFHQALHRAVHTVNERNPIVKLQFSRNSLAIMAQSPEIGESCEKLAINYKGPDINIGFNPYYVLDALQNLDHDEIFLELTDELSPGVIKVNAPFLYVVMPMRIV